MVLSTSPFWEGNRRQRSCGGDWVDSGRSRWFRLGCFAGDTAGCSELMRCSLFQVAGEDLFDVVVDAACATLWL